MNSSKIQTIFGHPCDLCPAHHVASCRTLSLENLKSDVGGPITSFHFANGACIFQEHEANDHVYNVISGCVMTTKTVEAGRRQVLDFLFDGDFLGSPFGAEHTFGAFAVGQVRVCRISRAKLQSLTSLSTPFFDDLIARTADSIERAQEHIVALGSRTAIERVAAFVLMIARKQQTTPDRMDIVYLPMTRACIADYTGLSLETVCRAFTTLKTRGVISLLSPTLVQIFNRRALESLRDGE